MENELYYRGSGTYETAVQNQLSRLQNSNVMLRNSIRDMEYGIRSDIRKSTYAIVASQAMLAQTFQHGFNSINNTLEIGFDRMSAQMSDIADAISAMSDKICSKLDEIHDIVNNPLLTQSRELYRRALTNFEKGYYEEALEDIKAAVEKNKTDFISWNLLGQIYLFGAGKFSNVINLDEAENAFFNAAKYIDADIGQSEEADKLASEIYYYLGYTRLIKSNDMLVESKIDESNKKLIEAESASGRAYQISKENILAGYEQAKELHFLGKDDEALNIIEAIIRAESAFALKASNDKNFESMWDKIDSLIERLRDEVAEKAREKARKILAKAEKKIEALKAEVDELEFPDRDEVAKISEHIAGSGTIQWEKERFEDELKFEKEYLDSAKESLEISEKTVQASMKAKAHSIEMGWDTTDDDNRIKDYEEDVEKCRQEYREQKAKVEHLQQKIKFLTSLKNNSFSYIDKESFLKTNESAISSLKNKLKEYEQLETADYLSALKTCEDLSTRDSSGYFDEAYLQKPENELYKIKLFCEFVGDNMYDFKQEIKRKERNNKEYKRKAYIVFALMCSCLIASVVLFLLHRFGIQIVLNIVAWIAYLGIKKEKNPRLAEWDKALSENLGIKEEIRFPDKIYPIVIGLIAVGLFITGHWGFGVINALLALFALI